MSAKLLNTTMKETHALSGCLLIEVYDLMGNRLLQRRQSNLITNQGRLLVAQLFSGEIQGIDKDSITMAIGKGADQPRVEDQRLQDLVAQTPATVNKPATTVQGNSQATSLKLTANFPPLADGDAEPQAITEAGVLLKPTSNPSPILYNRVVFPAVNRTSQVSLSLTWEVTF